MNWRHPFRRRPEPDVIGGLEGNDDPVPPRVLRHVGSVTADNPIRKPDEDLLGRNRAAGSFAEHILSLDATEGVVVGVLGPWGSGKTSFLNLARERLGARGVTVLEFNPWMFSGADQLIEAFFVEISSQLRIRPALADVGNSIEGYGEIFGGVGWLPLVGPWLERGHVAAKAIAKLLQRKKEGIGGRRAKVEQSLAALENPIVVVIDDVDRLTTSECRDMFKLVRLTASFPNIIYVVAFDRNRVENALADQGIPGRDYLEKILQVALDLPAIPSQILGKQALLAIDRALTDVDKKGPFDEEAWLDVFVEVIRPLLRNMRDVRRYVAALTGTVKDLDGRISLVDVLALEAVRVFLPDAFRQIHFAVEGLTATSGIGLTNRGDPPRLKEQIDRLIAAAGDHAGVARSIVERLFPAGQRHVGGSNYGPDWMNRWLKERRVAHEAILRLYLERSAGEGLLAFTAAERAWFHMADRSRFESYLRSLSPERIQDVVSWLEAYEDEFSSDHVVPGSVVLLNLLPDIPEREGGLFEFNVRMIVGRVIYRLVRSLQHQGAIEGAVREILPQLATLSSKELLLRLVGHKEGAGHKLVSEPIAHELELAWRDEVRSASAESLAAERELLRVVVVAKRDATEEESALEIPDAPEVTIALLRSARTNVRSQTEGSRSVRRSPRLAWEVLTEMYGSEEVLAARMASLGDVRSTGDTGELIKLAERYLSGWRPGEFGDD